MALDTHKQRGPIFDVVNKAVKRLRVCESFIGCQNQVVLHELQQADKPVSHGVFTAYNFFDKAPNRDADRHDTHTRISFVLVKSRVFLLQISRSVSILRYRGCFLRLPFKILRGKLARGRPELIPSRMLDV